MITMVMSWREEVGSMAYDAIIKPDIDAWCGYARGQGANAVINRDARELVIFNPRHVERGYLLITEWEMSGPKGKDLPGGLLPYSIAAAKECIEDLDK